MLPLPINHFTATSCIGRGQAAMLASLEAARSGLKPCDFESVVLDTQIGEVGGIEAVQLPAEFAAFDCRNNRLAQLGLEQDGFADAVRASTARWGAERIGVFLGTSTSGILETELAFRDRDPATGALPRGFDYQHRQNSFSVSDYVRRSLRLAGPAATLCTACSSSAKAFAVAQRMIAAGLIDAAVVGGVDSLCLTTLYGFHALQLTAPAACRPFDLHRNGLSIGEAAAFALLERTPASDGRVWLLGYGESSDAHHMSSPHPQGAGARLAMQRALEAAAMSAEEVDYINLHGTGTPSNDSAESMAVCALFGERTPCSSTKAATGHTLGAAGALEAVICILALRHGLLPAGLNRTAPDPRLQLNYLTRQRRAALRTALSNSFGFGGVNCALLFGRAA
ncbi:MAG TPA: beta-ketoacyl-[acyl-carrier-protein] synthase family protein [Steroidobacteraceae bacterium]|jgi:3-oxoacyl-[acyl-carrier-protein] synthase-1